MAASEPTYSSITSGCVDSCQRCHHAVLELAVHLMEIMPSASKTPLFSALVQCIGLTRLTAEMILTDSGAHQEACRLTALACRSSAGLCDGTVPMQDCKKACIECAECCERACQEFAA